MQLRTPSRTALAAATYRAAHQVLERGSIFSDPLALRIIGADAETVARAAEDPPSGRGMRIFIAARSRFAEDALAAAIEKGASQLVILGAGLDTFAYRSPLRNRVRIFEVDHPDTQAWKRQRLEEAGIPIPGALTFAPINFEHQTLAEGLAAAGFDPGQQTFFFWLGVVHYLTEAAILSTLSFISGLANGAHVVLDYSDPPGSLPEKARIRHETRAAYVAGLGEAWLTFFEAHTLRSRLMALGFSEVEDLGPQQIATRYSPERTRPVPDKGGHILRATTLKSG